MRGFSNRAVIVWIIATGVIAVALKLWSPGEPMWASVTASVPRWALLTWVPLLAASGWPVVFGGIGLLAVGTLQLRGPDEPPERAYRFVAANLQAYAEPSDALDGMLAATGADVLITIEERERAVEGAVERARWTDRPKASYGMGVWCRGACEAQILGPFGGGQRGMPVATVSFEGACVVGVHVPPPFSGKGQDSTDAVESQFAYLSALEGAVDPATGELVHDLGACTSGQPTLWIGDFNASPGTGLYRAVSALGLIDLFAWPETHAGSWPNGGGWPRFAVLRLDHAFASPGLDARAHMRSIPGSDHRAVVVDWMR